MIPGPAECSVPVTNKIPLYDKITIQETAAGSES